MIQDAAYPFILVMNLTGTKPVNGYNGTERKNCDGLDRRTEQRAQLYRPKPGRGDQQQ